MRAGQLDRKITLLSPPDPDDLTPLGEPASEWTPFTTTWAEFRPDRGRDLQRSGRTVSEAIDIFMIRWISGVTTAMRLVHDADTYEIQLATEVGRRRGLELVCRKVS